MDKSPDEVARRAMARTAESFAQAAEQLIPCALGDAVMALSRSGRLADAALLLEWLEARIAESPSMRGQGLPELDAARLRFEAAARWLRPFASPDP